MAFSWRSAGFTYLKYSQVCAQALRQVVKADKRAAVQIRDAQGIKIAKWTKGTSSESNFIDSSKNDKQ